MAQPGLLGDRARYPARLRNLSLQNGRCLRRAANFVLPLNQVNDAP